MRTVFIVGAGASKEFDLPLGSELANWIRANLLVELSGGSTPIIQSAMQQGLPGNYSDAAEDIIGGMVAARSIDRYLHSRRDRPLVQLMGKQAIAAGIAVAERGSKLMLPDGYPDFQAIHEALIRCRGTWIGEIFSILHEGFRPEDADQVFDQIGFVTFNYDRTIERYLRLAFEQVFHLGSIEAAAIVARIPIKHVYGSLGALPVDAEGVSFGPAWGRELETLSGGIRTFTEQHDHDVLESVRALVASARSIVFLGFAFDPLNMEALFDRQLLADVAYGTSIGVPGTMTQGIYDRLRELGVQYALLNQQTCADLVRTPDYRSAIFPD